MPRSQLSQPRSLAADASYASKWAGGCGEAPQGRARGGQPEPPESCLCTPPYNPANRIARSLRMLKLKKAVADRYQGKSHHYDNDPYSSVVIFGWWYERHWTSKVAHVLVEFWLEHWK